MILICSWERVKNRCRYLPWFRLMGHITGSGKWTTKKNWNCFIERKHIRSKYCYRHEKVVTIMPISFTNHFQKPLLWFLDIIQCCWCMSSFWHKNYLCGFPFTWHLYLHQKQNFVWFILRVTLLLNIWNALINFLLHFMLMANFNSLLRLLGSTKQKRFMQHAYQQC